MLINFDWLLDPALPGVRYLALRDVVGLPADDPELVGAQKAAYTKGPIANILENMQPVGYWSEPGPGYRPKYFSTVWSLITLSQLGASAMLDERIGRACTYMMDTGLTSNGQFTTNGTPSGTIDCLQGNLCATLVTLGFDDPRLTLAFDWMARTVTGDGIAPSTEKDALLRYYAYKCGPLFACGANNNLSCAWGAAKVMLAFASWPAECRTPIIDKAMQHGVDFLFSTDPARADYPSGLTGKPSSNWWKFGFPVFYVTDILQVVEVLVALGHGADPRLANALDLLRQKQDAKGRWSLDYDYTGKTWVNFGTKKKPNPWVTLRALHVLKKVDMI